ncbi:MAG: zinc-ribbon domain-containing protein, partial [Deltaproteobacteria bacterium]
MEVTCKHCGATLSISDDKVPKGQVITARCSRCREKIEIDTRLKSGEERNGSSCLEPSSGNVASKRDQRDAEDEVLEYYEEGVKLALVMGNTAEQRDKIEKHLDAMGFRCVLVDETRKGIGKMRLHHFDLVILPEDLGGVPLDQSPIIHF